MMRYFKEDDFKCKCGCGFDSPNWFKLEVDYARGEADTSFVLNSAARCKTHNSKVGGSLTSTHLDAIAVDIRYNDIVQMAKIIIGLSKAGFVRIGINEAKKFVHADKDKTKPAAIFKY